MVAIAFGKQSKRSNNQTNKQEKTQAKQKANCRMEIKSLGLKLLPFNVFCSQTGKQTVTRTYSLHWLWNSSRPPRSLYAAKLWRVWARDVWPRTHIPTKTAQVTTTSPFTLDYKQSFYLLSVCHDKFCCCPVFPVIKKRLFSLDFQLNYFWLISIRSSKRILMNLLVVKLEEWGILWSRSQQKLKPKSMNSVSAGADEWLGLVSLDDQIVEKLYWAWFSFRFGYGGGGRNKPSERLVKWKLLFSHGFLSRMQKHVANNKIMSSRLPSTQLHTIYLEILPNPPLQNHTRWERNRQSRANIAFLVR